MTRKEWLKKFMWLVHKGATVVEYRRHLRIMRQQMPGHVAKIPQYQKELRDLEMAEELEATKKERAKEAAARARAAAAKARAEKQRLKEEEDARAAENSTGQGEAEGESKPEDAPQRDSETLGS